ncbi:unnamed protein product [Cochlearia groenlandica]
MLIYGMCDGEGSGLDSPEKETAMAITVQTSLITANQGFYLLGLYYATSTFAYAMQNSVPAITFIMACALKLEHIDLVRKHGVAKVSRTIVRA